MKKIVVFTGAGVSADSGLATFRDSDGLWANYRIEDVCTPEALRDNRAQVVDFYNMRRREMLGKEPNAGHRAIAGLEKCFDVEVITQNVDNLHERAGSSRVTHLHGELTKLRSSRDPELIVPIDGWEQRLDATAPDGALLRPHIVFFGEAVPMFERAAEIAGKSRYGDDPQSAHPYPFTCRRGHARTGGAVEVGILLNHSFSVCRFLAVGRQPVRNSSRMICRVAPEGWDDLRGL